MKIGILGGTFDPPHQAHLEIANRSIKQFTLDKVIFIPSGNPWQKKDCLLYTSPSPRDKRQSRMPSSA